MSRLIPITLNVNGQDRQVEADPATPLLWVLRDALDLVGTKFGCGGGFCGACTVHLDGQPRRACVTAVREVGARRVTTIEGLSADGTHPLQRAWIDIDVPQCGYCQAGQLMTAAALLARTPQPAEDAIAAAMTGNICRCGTYLRIRRAVRAGATGAAGARGAVGAVGAAGAAGATGATGATGAAVHRCDGCEGCGAVRQVPWVRRVRLTRRGRRGRPAGRFSRCRPLRPAAC